MVTFPLCGLHGCCCKQIAYAFVVAAAVACCKHFATMPFIFV